MNKINYGKILESELEKIESSEKKPTLLLHSCCAPCSSYVLEYLFRYFNIILYYYNPNISPEAEYLFRKNELERFVKEFPNNENISFTDAEYDSKLFFELVKGHENDPERGERCRICLAHRIEQAAKKAVQCKADYFTTTLSISPMKDAQFLNEQGKVFSEIYGVPYLFSDFKKKGGYLRSIELSREYNLYRQNYCGCVFSKREAELRENLKNEKTKA